MSKPTEKIIHSIRLLFLGSAFTLAVKLAKLRSIDKTSSDILKQDAINVYNESIDESAKQPLIDLLKKKSQQLDPDLKKRLQLYKEWQIDSGWTIFYKQVAIVWPVFVTQSFFPSLSTFAMLSYAFATTIKFQKEKQIITGGKTNSFFTKDFLPKQQTIEKVFIAAGYGLIALSLAKFGLSKLRSIRNEKIISEWKKNNQKSNDHLNKN